MTDHDEILRLRERYHELANILTRLDLGQREALRQLSTLERQQRALTKRLDGMTHADEIVSAVAAAVRQDRRNLFSWPRKIAGGILVVIMAAPALSHIAGWFG